MQEFEHFPVLAAEWRSGNRMGLGERLKAGPQRLGSLDARRSAGHVSDMPHLPPEVVWLSGSLGSVRCWHH